MSQDETLRILVQLGGHAAGTMVSEKAKRDFPKTTLWTYTGKRLTQLKRGGLVERTKTGSWRITEAGWRYVQERGLGAQVKQ